MENARIFLENKAEGGLWEQKRKTYANVKDRKK
jgi:hypothetical protein